MFMRDRVRGFVLNEGMGMGVVPASGTYYFVLYLTVDKCIPGTYSTIIVAVHEEAIYLYIII